LAYDPDTGLFWGADYSGNIFIYDAVNNVRTQVANGAGYNFSGLAFSSDAVVDPIPVPFTLPLLATGFGLMGVLRMKRRAS
jgi:hypothetical protein